MTRTSDVIDVFLCHTGANKDFVRDLAQRLEGETVDGRPLRVFFDEWDIAPGENILTRIDEGLKNSRFLAVALSPALTQASWPTMEWQTQVYDDPSGKRGRIIPLVIERFDRTTLEPLEIPPVLRLLRYLDFSRPERFEREFSELVRRVKGLRPVRGGHSAADAATAIGLITGPEAPDPVDEVLLANLLPVSEMPSHVYSDTTTAKGPGEVWRSMTGPLRIPFVLHSKRLYTFAPPAADSPFTPFWTGLDPRAELTADWIKSEDHLRHAVWMLNDALRERCYALKIRTPPTDRKQFYPPSFDGLPRVFSWGKGRPITLAKVSTKGERPLGVHRSARMRFMSLGQKLYLWIEPGYFFTTDGVTPLEGRQVGILSIKWGGREGNDTVLRQTIMWARLLASGLHSIDLPVGGGRKVSISSTPIHSRLTLGIANDAGNIGHLLSGEGAGEVVVDGEMDDLDVAVTSHERGEVDIDGEAEIDAIGLTDLSDNDADEDQPMAEGE